jgi:hypothetical protein
LGYCGRQTSKRVDHAFQGFTVRLHHVWLLCWVAVVGCGDSRVDELVKTVERQERQIEELRQQQDVLDKARTGTGLDMIALKMSVDRLENSVASA